MNEVMMATETPKIDDPFGNEPVQFFAAPVAQAQHIQQEVSESTSLMVQIMAHAHARPRDINQIMRMISAHAQMMGTAVRYRWEVNNRATGTKDVIEGPTIKAAMMVAREYGNCAVGAKKIGETHDHWIFEGRFIDFQTGFIVVREFQQRKSQMTGMKDQDRARDIVFQIGQSKAARNAVVNALSTLIDFAMSEADRSVLEWVKKDPGNAKKVLRERIAGLGIELKRVETKRARTIDNMTAQDIAITVAEIRAIQEQQATIEDIYGDAEVAAAKAEAQAAEVAENKATATAKMDGRTKAAREAKKTAEAAKEQDTRGQPVGDANDAGSDAPAGQDQAGETRSTQGAEGEVAANPSEPAAGKNVGSAGAQGASAGANAEGPAGNTPPAAPDPAKPTPKLPFDLDE